MQGQCGSSRKKAKKGGCDGNCTGGSRRKTRGRRMRGGAGYGVGSAIAAGALEYKPAYTGAADPKTGAAVEDATDPRGGYTGIGGRRRKTRKGRKGRKGTRKMRGGSASMGAMKANAGFSGEGERGLATYRDVNAPGPGTNAY
jgi:hypothetical protein